MMINNFVTPFSQSYVNNVIQHLTKFPVSASLAILIIVMKHEVKIARHAESDLKIKVLLLKIFRISDLEEMVLFY